jgi:ABC-type branched-subunit amino acid transport system substrate-binding protein
VAVIPGVYPLPAGQGLIHTSVIVSPSATFKNEYNKAYGTVPTLYSFTSYNAVEVFAKALNYVVKHNEAINGNNIRIAINTIKKFHTEVGSISFTKNRAVSAPVQVVQIRNGKDTVLPNQ